MPTAKQIAASRANGQKSRGPITQEGKAKSRYNAMKHGIDAKQQIMFAESAEDLAELAAEYHELHSPANPEERFLVDTLVNNEWRLRRLRVVEADLWQSAVDAYLDKHTETESATTGQAFITCGPAFERLQRIVNSCERHYKGAMKELQNAQAARADRLASSESESGAAQPPDPHAQPAQSTAASASSGSFYSNSEQPPGALDLADNSSQKPDAAV
jgi:hypothetical protein